MEEAEHPSGPIGFVSFSRDGKRLAASFGLREVRILDAESGQEISPTLKVLIPTILEFSPNDKRLVTGLIDGTVKLWDVTSGQETLTLKGHTNAVTGLAFSPNGRRPLSASSDKTVRIWNATPLPE